MAITLLAVFAALGAYVWLFERGEVGAPLAWRLDPARIQRIELTSGGRTTVLSRRGGSWRITEPVSAPVDRDHMRQFLGRLAKLEIRRRIARPQNLKAYGLAKPAATVRIVLSGEKRRELVLGERTPDSSSAYAMKKGADDVLLVAPALLDDAVGGAAALRDHAALRFKAAGVAGVTLTRPDGRIKLAKGKRGWAIVEPVATRADGDAVSGFLTSLEQLRAARFVAESAPNPAQYSLHQPRLVIELGFSGGREPARLAFGAATAAGEYYARNSREPAVMALPQAAFAGVDRTLDDLRSHLVAEFRPPEVQRIAIARGDQRFELRRWKDGGWFLTSPSPAEADADKVEDLLYALADLRAHGFIDHPQSLAAYGLDPFVAAVTLYRGRGRQPARFIFGGPAGEGRIYAKSSGDTIFGAPADILSQLPAGMEALRERRPSQDDSAPKR